jgi:hypothetical protein
MYPSYAQAFVFRSQSCRLEAAHLKKTCPGCSSEIFGKFQRADFFCLNTDG